MIYYDTRNNTKITEFILKQKGMDAGSLRMNGIYPLEYVYPEYDRYTQTVEPSGNPKPKEDNPEVYVEEFVVKELPQEKKEAILQNLKTEAKTKVNNLTFQNIVAGFDYTFNTGKKDEILHFSYDKFDQGNFTDSATVVLHTSHPVNDPTTLPTEVSWNAYRNYTPETGGELIVLKLTQQTFLPIYAAALNHKTTKLAEGTQRKALIEASTTAKKVIDYLTEWGIA